MLPDMSGTVVAIFVAPAKHAEQLAVDAVQLKAGKGIVGDRFFGFSHKHPGRNLTLIESEVVEAFNHHYGQAVGLSATRRNLVTRGIRLNDLIGRTFKVGDILCQGIELCEPCKVMTRYFPPTSLSQTEIIQAFTHKGGIRVAVLTNGVVKLGDNLNYEIAST